MCGIAGIIYFGRHRGNFSAIRQMTDSMCHRGPDDEGFVLWKETGNMPSILGGKDTPESVFAMNSQYSPRQNDSEGPFQSISEALGHRRLAILDLSPYGHQPMCTEDGRYWIVYNGEVFNYREIRESLKSSGEHFVSDTDTEVILKAYRKWGVDSLHRFNGMWAFAIRDSVEKTLFCCRDRIGIKPFYYHLSPEFFLFASEVRALFASSLLHPKLDPNGIYHGMALQIAPRPLTAFQGIRALKQGEYMFVNKEGEVKTSSYWKIPTGATNHKRSLASYADELESRLKLAVSRCLVSDVPVGTFMSGGIDSTLVTSLAAREQPGIKAFTLVFDSDTGMDERLQAEAAASLLPITHITKNATLDHNIVLNSEITKCQEEPFGSTSPNYLIAQLASNSGAVVILSGLGGDELFAGYSRHSLLPHWKTARILNPITRMLPSKGKIAKVKQLANLETITDYYVYIYELFHRAERTSLLHPDLMAQVEQLNTAQLLSEQHGFDANDCEDDIQALCCLDILNYVGNHFMPRLDQFTMQFSLEGRFPLLDHELVEFAMTIPSELKVRNGIGKYLLRNVASKYIHPSCLQMKKMGFGLPMGIWVKGPLRNFVDSKLESLGRSPIFRPGVIDRIRKDKDNIPHQKLWYLVSFQLWLEYYGIS